MHRLRPVSKALAGFIAPAVVLLPAALLPVSDGGTTLTGYEVAVLLAACFGTTTAVYSAPRNRR